MIVWNGSEALDALPLTMCSMLSESDEYSMAQNFSKKYDLITFEQKP